MVFSSNTFLFLFLPAVLIVYFLSPRRYRNAVLLLVSLFFYGWGEPRYLFIMVGVILLNYFSGLLIEKKPDRARLVLVLSVVVNLAVLSVFKYTAFIMESVSSLFRDASSVRIPQIALPIGISFYIFQSLSYTIDVYRGKVPAQHDLISFGAYVALFPQLIAGPIVRYSDIAERLEYREENINDFASGISRFIIGLGKKVLIANQMGAFWTEASVSPGTLSAWVGMLAYSFQIYFDFSGYSDMAIGLGRMFGFEFLENFDYPYISKSVTEFWRRWHISLSSWFKEYVYIPLGGNRKGTGRQLLNILIVWALTGLWHGASWNFVLWGLYYAVLLIAEKLFLLKAEEKLPGIVRHLLLLLAVAFGWMLFYFEDMSVLASFVKRLVSFTASTQHELHTIIAYVPILCIAALASVPAAGNLFRKHSSNGIVYYSGVLFLAIVFLLSVSALTAQSYNPFIYFRF